MRPSLVLNRLQAVACALAVTLGLSLSTGEARAQTFTLTGVAFDESVYLDAEVLAGIGARYTGRRVSFADLQELVSEVQALYAQAGIVTARALLPPQEIRDGVLRVALVEAAIETVAIEGLERTNPEFLRGTISLREGEQPDFDRLERDLRIYDIMHDIAPRLSFAPGTAPGSTRATISGEEPRPVSWTASIDNFGREETGVWRGSVFMRWASVSGVRDSISLQLQATQGSQSISAGYSRPVGLSGARLIAAGSFSRSNIIAGGFTPINVVANSTGASLTWRQPVAVRGNSHWLLDGALAYEQNTSTTSGLAFFDMTIVDATFSATYALRRPNALWSFTGGLRGGSADAGGASATEGAFALAFGSVSHSRNLGQRFVLEADAQVQLAPGQNLPVARLLSAGGSGVLRGYPNNVRSGDSGALFRLQLSPSEGFAMGEAGNIDLRPFGFVDAGLVVPFRPAGGIDASQDYLASIGGGVRANFRDQFTGLAMLAVPLINTLGFTRAGNPNFYLGLDYRF
ncbi:MAG: ShlB/FhaC/HecB family hemolysin secretion/activation protein [Rhodobacteraceae bacterium]|nr:ShlB/FhaC/HecB family hemolysin secretion/activation protein [Paracoccaceae bacterium]